MKEQKKEEKIVTATKKGSAVLDTWLPDHIKAQYHVLHIVSHLNVYLSKHRRGEKYCIIFWYDL